MLTIYSAMFGDMEENRDSVSYQLRTLFNATKSGFFYMFKTSVSGADITVENSTDSINKAMESLNPFDTEDQDDIDDLQIMEGMDDISQLIGNDIAKKIPLILLQVIVNITDPGYPNKPFPITPFGWLLKYIMKRLREDKEGSGAGTIYDLEESQINPDHCINVTPEQIAAKLGGTIEEE